MNPVNTQVNKANMSALGPWLVILMIGLDNKFGWGFTLEWYGALSSLVIWVCTYAVANRKKPRDNSFSSFAGVLLMITLLMLLSACASPVDKASKLIDTDELKAVVEGEKSAAQALADDLLGEAQGLNNRAMRVCFIAAGVSELMAQRVRLGDVEFATEALGNIAILQSVQTQFETADPYWMETDINQATAKLFDVVESVVRDRIPRLLSAIASASAGNIFPALDRAKIAAAQISLKMAIVKDIKRAVANPDEAASASCKNRLELNRTKLQNIASGL